MASVLVGDRERRQAHCATVMVGRRVALLWTSHTLLIHVGARLDALPTRY
jgi:hypothetical protein